MHLCSFFSAFQRFALYEKNLTPCYIKDILRIVCLLEEQTTDAVTCRYDTERIADFLHLMSEQRGWSAKTFRNYRQNLKTFFDFLVRKQYLKVNPVSSIAKPRIPKQLPRCLSKEQVDKLIRELYGYSWRYPLEYWRNTAIVFTFLYTGIRLSELLSLKTVEVNFKERYLYVVQGKGKKDRYVPLHPKLVPMLQFYLAKRKERLGECHYFFTSVRSAKPLTVKNLYAIFKKLSLVCGFNITPHPLRHTMAKLSLEANLNPYTLKEILGHSNIASTQIYMSVSTQSINRSFSKLDLL